MILLRAWYGDWKPADEEKARSFAKHMVNALMKGTRQEKLGRVNQKHIRGISFTLEDLDGNRIES